MLLFVPAASAQNPYGSTEVPLRNIGGIVVIVEELPSAFEGSILDDTSIKTNAEMKLRSAGITVHDQRPSSPFSYLYIRVSVLRSSSLWAFSVEVKLEQTVLIASDLQTPILATTWEAGGLGTVRRNNLRDVRLFISDFTDQFVNDYLAAQVEAN